MVMSLILSILFFPFCTSLDTLTPNQFIKDDQSLVSKGNNFALGFFSPGNSSYQYLGIWFVKVTKQTVVWVANRNDPINGRNSGQHLNTGYEPKSRKGWYHRDGSEGCVKKNLGLSMCCNGKGFLELESVKGPDSSNAAWMETSMSSSECQQACLSNCSCTAFISMDIEGKGTVARHGMVN
ncbi:hypothetical protein SO802_007671 [Lithocarpus litseifolius]|uniref:Uncharacterized protein n=1 Tax=Lithocarpus litseifolius TaxID=425828 RepID=A0AAW2DSP1_9ROSI